MLSTGIAALIATDRNVAGQRKHRFSCARLTKSTWQVLSRRVCEVFGPFANAVFARPLEDDGELRLGAAPAHEDASLVSECLGNLARELRKPSHFIKGLARGKSDILEHLGKALHRLLGELAQRLLFAQHERQDL